MWDEAFEALADPGSGLSESGQYFASSEDEARTLTGPFDERPQQGLITDDELGRQLPRLACWQVPLSDGNGAVAIATNGKAWCVVRNVKWRIIGLEQDRASWVIELQAMDESNIRKVQKSTRR